MWILFHFFCDPTTQKTIHRNLRQPIRDWQKSGLVNESILSYHGETFYLCLDIPSVDKPAKESRKIFAETAGRIPTQIKSRISTICENTQITTEFSSFAWPSRWLELIDYKFLIQEAKKSIEKPASTYYNGAPIDEVLRFASIGTKVALEYLQSINDNDEEPLCVNSQLKSFLCSRLKAELGEDYRWWKEAFHFAVNSLDLHEIQFMGL